MPRPVVSRPSQQAMHDRLYTAVDGILLVGDYPGSRGDHKDIERGESQGNAKTVLIWECVNKILVTSVQRWVVVENVTILTVRRCCRCSKHGLGR